MARIFVTASTEGFERGEVELMTLYEKVLCDNPECPYYYVRGGIPDEFCGNLVVRNGEDFCSEACYLETPDGQARMELATSAENIPPITYGTAEEDRRFTNMPPPRDATR